MGLVAQMDELEIAEIKREQWTAGFLNGALKYGDFVDMSVEELKGWIADREYKEYVAEQLEQERRNRG